MNYNSIFTYYKAIIISVIASVTDITLMYELDTNTKINDINEKFKQDPHKGIEQYI